MYDDYEYEEPTQDEMEEMEGANATTTEMTNGTLKIEFNTENFVSGIVCAVTSQVKKELYTEIISEIKRNVLSDMKEKIQYTVGEIIKEIILDYMQNEKITIGGNSFFDKEPLETYSMKEYAKKCIGESIKDNKFRVVTSIEKDRYSGYKTKTTEYSYDEYIRSGLAIGNDVKEYIDKQVMEIKNNVNKDVKNIFDESTKKMLSESVLNVLMANDTYKKIESNLACIADRSVN